ncbi:MAG TPA: alkaline phosphatase family protein, partial [Gemmataceae bacterium]|nr:alkaline phosphatase family protein [Gemmataceae bacterium]
SPEQLLPGVTTVGDALHAASGGRGRVFSLSIKDRTAVLMGGRNPTGVYCFDTRDGRFHTGEFYREQPHPWVEQFNKSGRVDKWFGMNWERLKPETDYNRFAGPDAAAGEAPGRKQGLSFPHPTTGGKVAVGPEYYEAVETSPLGNELLFELAKTAVTSERLGTNGTSDLLCVSFSSNDLIGHYWGPDSHEVMDITLRSDRLVGEFLKFLDETVGPNQYVVVITADHGVCPIPEQKHLPTAARVKTTEAISSLAAALDEKFGPGPTGPTRWLEATDFADRIWPWIFLSRKAIATRGLNPTFDEACEFTAEWLGNRPYMLCAFTRKQIEANAPPLAPGREVEVRAVFERVKLAYHPDRCGDVIAVVKPGVLVTPYPAGTSHGTPHDYDTHVPVLVYGAGVPAMGKRSERVSSLIVAPTVAWGLGIHPPTGAVERVPDELNK